MEKRLKPIIFALAFINFIGVVSAQFYSSYGRFSFGNFLNSLDVQVVVFFISLIIFFALLHLWIIGRLFRGNNTLSAIISGALAFGMSYGIYKLEFFDVDSLLFSLGISGDVLWPILVLILTLFILLMVWKFKSKAFWLLGIMLILLGSTDLIYEGGIALSIGIVSIGIGLVWSLISKGKYSKEDEIRQAKKGWTWALGGFLLFLLGSILSFGYLIIAGIILWVAGLLIQLSKEIPKLRKKPKSYDLSKY